jgi:hypothetical protein
MHGKTTIKIMSDIVHCQRYTLHCISKAGSASITRQDKSNTINPIPMDSSDVMDRAEWVSKYYLYLKIEPEPSSEQCTYQTFLNGQHPTQYWYNL